jgi:hypothetical protein
MNVKDINKEVQQLREREDSLNNMLSTLFNVIERFENNGRTHYKDDKDKVDVLKNIIKNMVKDAQQKEIIKGGA